MKASPRPSSLGVFLRHRVPAKAGSAALLIWLGRVYLGQREPAPAPPPETATFDRAFAVLRQRRAERAGPQPAVEAN